MKREPNLIYKVVSPSGNIYIGITNNWDARKRQHKSEKGSSLYPVIRKYGWDGLEVEVLCTALTREYAYELEVEFIRQYDSYNNGYNRSIGGEGRSIELFRDDEHVLAVANDIRECKLSYGKIAKKHGVSKWSVGELGAGRCRVDLTGGKIERTRRVNKSGEEMWKSIFTEIDVGNIKRRLMDGETNSEIAGDYNCSQTTIYSIKTGETWKHVKVEGFIPTKVVSSRICKKKIKQIENDLIHGAEVCTVSEKYNVKYHTCYRYYRLLLASGDIKKEG